MAKYIIDKLWDKTSSGRVTPKFGGKIDPEKDEAPPRVNSRDRGSDYWGGSIRYNVLKKMLRSKVGQNWSQIYSDFINSPMTELQRLKLREALEWLVEVPDVNNEIDNRFWHSPAFTVINDKLFLLKERETWKQKRKNQGAGIPSYFSIDGQHYYWISDPNGRWDKGNWYCVTKNPTYRNTDSVGRMLCQHSITCGDSNIIKTYSSEDNLSRFVRRRLSDTEFREVWQRYIDKNGDLNETK